MRRYSHRIVFPFFDDLGCFKVFFGNKISIKFINRILLLVHREDKKTTVEEIPWHDDRKTEHNLNLLCQGSDNISENLSLSLFSEQEATKGKKQAGKVGVPPAFPSFSMKDALRFILAAKRRYL